jgi:omega-amidase
MQDLRVAFIQSPLHWHDKGANLAMFEEKIWGLDQKVDLIVLPEMFTTGFTMEVAAMAEPMNLTGTKWLKQMASQTKAVVTGSMIINENGKFYNRLIWAQPDGKILTYDKRHLFRMANEDHFFDMGMKREIFSCKGWNILPQICYDLRFPVWNRNRANKEGVMEYDLCFYIASWPAPRASAWDILLPARAVENLCYSLGVNRIGTDGNDIAYVGHSALYDFKGNKVADAREDEKHVVVTLSFSELQAYRNKFPAWKDADYFQIE